MTYFVDFSIISLVDPHRHARRGVAVRCAACFLVSHARTVVTLTFQFFELLYGAISVRCEAKNSHGRGAMVGISRAACDCPAYDTYLSDYG